MTLWLLGLGGNLGSRHAALSLATRELDAVGAHVRELSPIYETPPLGPPQPKYLNACVAVDWGGTPHELLEITQQLERDIGRTPSERWGPRLIDIDLLWGDGVNVNESDLVVPHPALLKRAFTLRPVLDLASKLSLPPAEVFEQLLSDLDVTLTRVSPPAVVVTEDIDGLWIECASSSPADAACAAINHAIDALPKPDPSEPREVEVIEAPNGASFAHRILSLAGQGLIGGVTTQEWGDTGVRGNYVARRRDGQRLVPKGLRYRQDDHATVLRVTWGAA